MRTLVRGVAGCEDDDGSGGDIRSLLAALPRLLHHHVVPAGADERALHPGALPGHLLARHVQQHVQPHHLLLDEFQVIVAARVRALIPFY